jgi:hypothetical protein
LADEVITMREFTYGAVKFNHSMRTARSDLNRKKETASLFDLSRTQAGTHILEIRAVPWRIRVSCGHPFEVPTDISFLSWCPTAFFRPPPAPTGQKQNTNSTFHNKAMLLSALLIPFCLAGPRMPYNDGLSLIDVPNSPSLDKRGLTTEEQTYIINEFRKDPNTTLLRIFEHELNVNVANLLHHPILLAKLPLKVIKAAWKLLATMLEDVAFALNWVAEGMINPRKADQDIKDYFHELKSSLKQFGVMWKKDHWRALSNFFGGFLYYLSHHGIEFSAQLILLLIGGGYVFHAIGDGVEASFMFFGLGGAESAAVLRSSLMGILWFLHCIDDPIAMFSSIMNPVLTMNNITATAVLQPQTKSEIQQEVFGVQGKTFDQMVSSSKLE